MTPVVTTINLQGRKIVVRFRYSCGTNHASALGCRASSTASPDAALKALIPKLEAKGVEQ